MQSFLLQECSKKDLLLQECRQSGRACLVAKLLAANPLQGGIQTTSQSLQTAGQKG